MLDETLKCSCFGVTPTPPCSINYKSNNCFCRGEIVMELCLGSFLESQEGEWTVHVPQGRNFSNIPIPGTVRVITPLKCPSLHSCDESLRRPSRVYLPYWTVGSTMRNVPGMRKCRRTFTDCPI